MKEELSDKPLNQTENILEDHKKMLIMSGNLSEFQLKNLKTWPFVLFNKIEEVKIDYDFSVSVDGEEGIGAGEVVYHLKTSEAPNKDNIETLKNWVKFLFWKDTKVEINVKL